ncbi:Uncharacterised protein g4340 [Pycnogonum litorale]
MVPSTTCRNLLRLGILFTILSSFCHATGNLFSKFISNDIGVMYVVCVRYIFLSLMSTPFMVKDAHEMQGVNSLDWFYLILSGVTLLVSSTLAFLALGILPIMDATTLLKIQPVFVNFISCLWLKERITWLDGLVTIVMIGSVVLICEPAFLFGSSSPPAEQNRIMLGELYAIISAVCAAFSTCVIRKIRFSGATFILFWQGIVTVIVCLPIGLLLRQKSDPVSRQAWVSLICAGLGETFYRTFLTVALMIDESTIVVSIQTVEILFSLIYEITLFDTNPSWFDLIGAVSVMAGVIALAFKDSIVSRQQINADTPESENLI